MLDAYLQAGDAPLPERLLRALEVGLAAGGEAGDERSAGLHVAEVHDWPVVDLRVDWHDEPIAELRRIWELYAPQRAAYEQRARAPSQAQASRPLPRHLASSATRPNACAKPSSVIANTTGSILSKAIAVTAIVLAFFMVSVVTVGKLTGARQPLGKQVENGVVCPSGLSSRVTLTPCPSAKPKGNINTPSTLPSRGGRSSMAKLRCPVCWLPCTCDTPQTLRPSTRRQLAVQAPCVSWTEEAPPGSVSGAAWASAGAVAGSASSSEALITAARA